MSLRLGPFVPLFASAGVLLAGNGMQATLIAIRADAEGFTTTEIGMMGTAYFLGFIIACLFTTSLIRRAGHTRVFGAFAAIAAICSLVMALLVDPWVWIGARLITGFCFSAVLTVAESWLNEKAESGDRARIFSVYRLVDLSFVTCSQLLLPVIGTGGFVAFAVMAIAFCAAVVPVSLSRSPAPAIPESSKIDVLKLWKVSPVAFVGCFTIGMTNSAFRTMGPVYARDVGLDVSQVAYFMTAGIIGAAVAQYPFGWLSDRIDRRWTLIAATSGAVGAGVFLSFFGDIGPNFAYAGIFMFGAFALPLYSLSAAHANDFAHPGEYVEISIAIILTFSAGALFGPAIVSVVIENYGSKGFFLYTSACHAILILFVLYRMTQRAVVPADQRSPFIALLRTSPAIFRLGRNGAGSTKPSD